MATFSIPSISKERVKELCKRIRPVVRDDKGKLCYMKKCNPFNQSFIWDAHKDMTVRAKGLKLFKVIPTLHTWAYYGFFKPTIEEVLAQIPEDIVNKVVAFETVGPDSAEDLNKDKEALNAGFHVASTFLYTQRKLSAKDQEEIPAFIRKPKKAKKNPAVRMFKKVPENGSAFLNTLCVVEASNEEHFYLWKEFSSQSSWRDTLYPERVSVSWEEGRMGHCYEIGVVAGFPITLCCYWDTIDGKVVMFWRQEGVVTNSEMAEKWIKFQCKNANTFVGAGDFFSVLRAIREANKDPPSLEV